MHVEYLKNSVKYNQRIKCNIIEQGIVNGDEEWKYYGVTSPFHRLYYLEEGEVFIRDGEKTHRLTKGFIYLIRRNTMMDYYAVEPFVKHYIHLNYSMHGGMDVLENSEPIVVIDLSVTQIYQLLKMFQNESLESYAQGVSVLYSVLSRALHMMTEEQIPMILKDTPYHQLLEEMIRRSDANFTVEAMALYCEQSTSDFSRKFKAVTGMSPKAYLHKQLIEESKMMLLTTDKSVKEIAGDLGYHDSLYFSRFFKKKVGVSPTKYRQSQIN